MIIEIPVRIEIGPECKFETLDQLYEEFTNICHKDTFINCFNDECLFKDKKCNEITTEDWKKIIKII